MRKLIFLILLQIHQRHMKMLQQHNMKCHPLHMNYQVFHLMIWLSQWKQSSRGWRELLIGRNLLLLEQLGRCGSQGIQHGGLKTTPRPFPLWHDGIHRLAPCTCWRTSQWLQALSCASDSGLYGCCNLWYSSCACYSAKYILDELRCEA